MRKEERKMEMTLGRVEEGNGERWRERRREGRTIRWECMCLNEEKGKKMELKIGRVKEEEGRRRE